MIAIIDYAINNLRSVEKAFQSLGVDVLATNAPEEIRKADKMVLPGVGAFADAMSNLKAKNLDGCNPRKGGSRHATARALPWPTASLQRK